MRTTVDLPDSLFRKAKITAAMRGITLKEVIIGAIEKEVSPAEKTDQPVRLPLVKMRKGNSLNLAGFDFDDLLA